MQRLFSNFAGGWPAFGLLLIRLAAGGALIVDGKGIVELRFLPLPFFLGLLTTIDGMLLVVGFCTPLSGIMAVVLSASELLFLHGILCPALLLSAMGAGLAIVGPGAFSVDAWLFGLKRIDIDRLEKPRH